MRKPLRGSPRFYDVCEFLGGMTPRLDGLTDGGARLELTAFIRVQGVDLADRVDAGRPGSDGGAACDGR